MKGLIDLYLSSLLISPIITALLGSLALVPLPSPEIDIIILD